MDVVRGRVTDDSAFVIVTRGPDRLVQRGDTADARGKYHLGFTRATGGYLAAHVEPTDV